MNTKIATLLVALMASLPMSFASASEAMKIGYVNTQRIFRDAPAAQKAAKKIESELEYPGQIKVNVIRETKAVEYAK